MKLNIETEVDKEILDAELRNSNIEAVFIATESEVLGRSSFVEGNVGYFEIRDQDYKLAKEIYDNIQESRVADTISEGKRNLVITGPKMLVSLLILFMLGTIGFLLYDNSRLEKMTHYAENLSVYTRKWNADKTVLSRYFKDSGILEAEYIDRNLNGKWKEEKFFDKSGKLRTYNSSSKDDGVFDTYRYYNETGALVQKFHDSDKTMRNDVFEIVVDPNNFYEFSTQDSGNSYYLVKKVAGQVK